MAAKEKKAKRPSGQAEAKMGYRMLFGKDLRYHFQDPKLRRKGGDAYDFDGTEYWRMRYSRDELQRMRGCQ